MSCNELVEKAKKSIKTRGGSSSYSDPNEMFVSLFEEQMKDYPKKGGSSDELHYVLNHLVSKIKVKEPEELDGVLNRLSAIHLLDVKPKYRVLNELLCSLNDSMNKDDLKKFYPGLNKWTEDNIINGQEDILKNTQVSPRITSYLVENFPERISTNDFTKLLHEEIPLSEFKEFLVKVSESKDIHGMLLLSNYIDNKTNDSMRPYKDAFVDTFQKSMEKDINNYKYDVTKDFERNMKDIDYLATMAIRIYHKSDEDFHVNNPYVFALTNYMGSMPTQTISLSPEKHSIIIDALETFFKK